MVAKRAEERLLFDHQRELAKLFGYSDNSENLAVEQFMHKYYRTVLALRELNDVLLNYLQQVILRKSAPKIIPLNERFQLCDGYIQAVHDDVFQKQPSALLEIFVLMAQHPEIQGVHASTIRLLRANRYLIDDNYRRDPKNTQLFLKLLQQSGGLVEQLRRMTRYGILGLYLPEFGR